MLNQSFNAQLEFALVPMPVVAPESLAAITCDSLEDIPTLTGPIMPNAACLLVPPVDLARLARAFSDTNWRWGMTMEERQARSKLRVGMDEREAFFRAVMDDVIVPSPTRLADTLSQQLADMATVLRPGDYIMGGGLITFRSTSGRIGLAVHQALGVRYGELKTEATQPGTWNGPTE